MSAWLTVIVLLAGGASSPVSYRDYPQTDFGVTGHGLGILGTGTIGSGEVTLPVPRETSSCARLARCAARLSLLLCAPYDWSCRAALRPQSFDNEVVCSNQLAQQRQAAELYAQGAPGFVVPGDCAMAP